MPPNAILPLLNGAVPVTVVIAARDAAAHIGGCVASATWAAETLVVEGGSGDDTRLIALSEGATVFTHPFATIGRQRNLAVERARHEWILVLDAEERCTPELAAEIRALVAIDRDVGSAIDAYAIRRRSMFGGRALRGGRWRPDAPLRLFRRRLRFDDQPGADRLVTGAAAVATLAAPLLRHVDVAHDAVAERTARAARDWATQQLMRGHGASASSGPIHALGRFVSSYLLRGGWRDGRAGLGLAFLDATEVALRWGQLWALSRDVRPPNEPVLPSTPSSAREVTTPRRPR